MTDVSSLPGAIVGQIIRRARSRCIPGTNKYARVCRQWQEASSTAEELQLFMNLGHMSAEELDLATDWMAVHGQAVTGLVIKASMVQTQQLQGLLTLAPALKCLRRLEVQQDNSLFLLAPVLGQLPQLQRLTAHVTVAQVDGTDTAFQAGYARVSPGQFVHTTPAHAHTPWKVPDLQQLCPQLTQLHLTLCMARGSLVVDGQLPRLLPAGLQELSLRATVFVYDSWLYPGNLVHLSALQQLSLDGFCVRGQAPGCVLQDLRALQQLQQLRLSHRSGWCLEASDVLQLASSIVSYGVAAWRWGVGEVLPHLVHVTRLALYSNCCAGNAMPEGIAEALAALTGLRELSFCGVTDNSFVPVLQQVAGMSNLQSLYIEEFDEDDSYVDDDGGPPAVSNSLAECTQLTALVVGSVYAMSVYPITSALQQLTGLRRLTVPELVLQAGAGAWLAPLTALTCLCVRLLLWVPEADNEGFNTRSPAVVAAVGEPCLRAVVQQQLLQRVPAWPAGLQQVLLMAVRSNVSNFRSECWQYTQAASGGAKFSVWLEEGIGSAPRWARPFRPCPHLPGVWELQGEFEGHDG